VTAVAVDSIESKSCLESVAAPTPGLVRDGFLGSLTGVHGFQLPSSGFACRACLLDSPVEGVYKQFAPREGGHEGL